MVGIPFFWNRCWIIFFFSFRRQQRRLRIWVVHYDISGRRVSSRLLRKAARGLAHFSSSGEIWNIQRNDYCNVLRFGRSPPCNFTIVKSWLADLGDRCLIFQGHHGYSIFLSYCSRLSNYEHHSSSLILEHGNTAFILNGFGNLDRQSAFDCERAAI